MIAQEVDYYIDISAVILHVQKLPAMVYLHCRNSFFKSVLVSSLFVAFFSTFLARKESVRHFFYFRKFLGIPSLNLISVKQSLSNMRFDIQVYVFIYLHVTKTKEASQLQQCTYVVLNLQSKYSSVFSDCMQSIIRDFLFTKSVRQAFLSWFQADYLPTLADSLESCFRSMSDITRWLFFGKQETPRHVKLHLF